MVSEEHPLNMACWLNSLDSNRNSFNLLRSIQLANNDDYINSLIEKYWFIKNDVKKKKNFKRDVSLPKLPLNQLINLNI